MGSARLEEEGWDDHQCGFSSPGAAMGKHSSKLAPEMLDDLVRSTEFSEQELKQWYKGFLKDCPTGILNLEEFQQLYIKVGSSWGGAETSGAASMPSSPSSFQFLFSPPRSFSPMETPPSLPSTLSAPLTRTGTAPSTSGSSSVPCLSPPGAPLSRNSTGPSRCTTWMGTGRSHAWRCWRSSRYCCLFAFFQVFHKYWVLFSTKEWIFLARALI